MAGRMLRGALAVLAGCAVASLVGCAPNASNVTSPWPVATSERTVPMPAGLQKWPLTGVSAGDGAQVDRRPLSVKIENAAAARPQSGPAAADVVYETLVEGGITRFNCLFQSSTPKTLGPVRSARLSDLTIVPQYDAIFVFSGASHAVDVALRDAGVSAISPDFAIGAPFMRVRSKPAPHNYYVSTEKAYSEAAVAGMALNGDVPGLQFGSAPTSGTPIARVSVPFSAAASPAWAWNPTVGTYVRSDGGRVQVDAVSGRQVSAANVVVIWTRYQPKGQDANGATTYNVTLAGQGRASVFRGGQRYDGSWAASSSAPPRFVAEDGTAIRLAPGSTWFEVVPLSTTITMR